MLNYRVLPLLCLALVFFAGCGDEPDFPNSLLSTVPAETSYLIASGEPLPKAWIEVFREAYLPGEQDLDAQLQQSFKALEENNPDLARRMRAVAEEFMRLLLEEDGLEQAGLSMGDNWVVYGRGLLPVARIAPTNPGAFRAFIERLFNAAELKPATGQHGGVEFWRVDAGSMLVLAGLSGDIFSMALTTPSQEAATLSHLFDGKVSGRSAADAGVVTALIDRYDFVPSTIGYLDTVRFTELLLGGGDSGIVLFKNLSQLPPACRKEIQTFAGRVPRLVFGYDQLSDDHAKGRWVIELDRALTEELKAWTAPVPGLGTESDALLMLGYSLNGIQAASSIRAWLQSMAERDFACPALADQSWTQAAGKVNAAPLHMAGNPKGLVFRLNALEIKTLQPLDFEMQASLVMLMENPQAATSLLKNFVPRLQSLEIPTDGSLVEVPDELTPKVDKPLFVAMTDHLLGISIGDESGERLGSAMSADTVEYPPFFQLHMDAGWFYSTLAKWMSELDTKAGAAEPDAKAMLEQQAAVMRAYGEIYDEASMRVGFTEHGIEFVSEMSLQ